MNKSKGILIEQALDDLKQLWLWTEESSKAIDITMKETVALKCLAGRLKRLYREERNKWYNGKRKEVGY